MSWEWFPGWKTEQQRGKVTWSRAQQTRARAWEKTVVWSVLWIDHADHRRPVHYAPCVSGSPELVWWRGEGCRGAVPVPAPGWGDGFALLLSPWLRLGQCGFSMLHQTDGCQVWCGCISDEAILNIFLVFFPSKIKFYTFLKMQTWTLSEWVSWNYSK